jgi:CBS domain-containing protein
LRVKEITNEKHPFVYEDELATKARAMIRAFNLRMLPVTDGDQKVLGIVSRGDLMVISSSVSAIRVKGIMASLTHVAAMDDDAFSTVKEMVRFDEWYVPVVNSSQDKMYKGVLGLENFIEFSIKTNPERLVKPVSEIMCKDVISCSPDDEVDNIWRLMQTKSFAGLPVTQKNKLVGMITQKDLIQSGRVFPTFESAKGRFRASPKISSIMKTDVLAVEPSTKVIRVAKIMVFNNIGRVPVKDEKDMLVGIVDREDIARLLVK